MTRRALLAALAGLVLAVPVAGALPPAAAAPGALALFPSDRLTVRDDRQLTGRRVALPLPDCSARPSECAEVRLINSLDGFDLDPRVRIDFTRRVDVRRVTPATVYLQPTGGGERIGLNRLVLAGATLYGQPVRQLRTGTTYALVVTAGVTGESGRTTFTTVSATARLERLAAAVRTGAAARAAGLSPAEQRIRFTAPDGRRTVFPSARLASVTRLLDQGPGALVPSPVFDLAGANRALVGFGSLVSPSYLAPGQVIPPVPTRSTPTVRGRERIGVVTFVPAGTPPPGGWPVAVYGCGVTRSAYDMFLAADFNAARGIATVATDPVGHGYGPRSKTAVLLAGASGPVTFPAYGRGRDLDGDGAITNQEGISAPVQPDPRAPVGLRDGLTQTVLDNMSLIRALRLGVDVDGDGTAELSRSRIGYYAQSLGGIYGTQFLAVEPSVRYGLLNVPGGPIAEIARLSPFFRPGVAFNLGAHRPSLLNGGYAGFTESQPLWADPPVTDPAAGAIPIQRYMSRVNWINRPGSPETYAPHLRWAPLAGIPAKRVLYQFAWGDQTVPNPTSGTIVRAGGLADVTTMFRNDLTPAAAANPHGFLLDPASPGRTPGQLQAAAFLDSAGRRIIDPDGAAPVFEVPIRSERELESLHYPFPPPGA
jgi:hypothetical protein